VDHRWGIVSSDFLIQEDGERVPELEMDNTFYTDLWYVVVVEEGVCDTRDAEEEDAGGRKE